MQRRSSISTIALRDSTKAERNSASQPSRLAASVAAVGISDAVRRPLALAETVAAGVARDRAAPAVDVRGELPLEVLPRHRPDRRRRRRAPTPAAAPAPRAVRAVGLRAGIPRPDPSQAAQDPDRQPPPHP